MVKHLLGVCFLCASCASWAQSAEPGQTPAPASVPESSLIQKGWVESELLQALQSINQMDIDAALAKLDALHASYPSYQLANLLRADLLAIKAGQYAQLKASHAPAKRQAARQAMLTEAGLRWQANAHQLDVSQKLLEQYLLKTSDEPYLVIVSTQMHRLFLYRQTLEGVDLVASYYISIGQNGIGKQNEGDLKTPIGLYHVVEYIDDAQLPELYGVAALTLNYPNQWDKHHGRTGSGIWLHGTPRSTFSRPPLTSRGCVVLNNPQMAALVEQFQIPAQTPVLILDKEAEQTEPLWQENQQALTSIQQWLQAHSKADWKTVSVLRYPGESGVFWVRFKGEDQTEVEQYWQKSASSSWQLVLQKSQPRVIAGLP